jgi:hypothetical protein
VRYSVFFLFFIIIFHPGISPGAGLSAQGIVARADSVRNPDSDFSVDVTITSMRSGKKGKVTKYEVFIKGRESIMAYSNMKPKSLPEKWFTHHYLKKLVY